MGVTSFLSQFAMVCITTDSGTIAAHLALVRARC